MLKARDKLGQYRIVRKLGEGGFADVYQAVDTIEGIRVALKIPHADHVTKQSLEMFRNEVRLTAQLDHPNILPIKYAGFLDGRFVIVYRLGKGSLEDRLGRRLSLRNALDYAEQMFEAVAFAHRRNVMHLDIKPENLILFDSRRLRLSDFGLARVARFSLSGSGSGTIGYIAPEQAMGKPTFRSDVFSLGLILYRMLTGVLPEWPYKRPLPGENRLRREVPVDLAAFVLRCLEVDQARRFANADQMRAAFRRIKPKALKSDAPRRAARRRRRRPRHGREVRTFRHRLFLRRWGRILEVRDRCIRCAGPVSEPMTACPWCGAARRVHRGGSRFPARCMRCRRGRKLDWRFCAWCFGPSFRRVSTRRYPDGRYAARCSNAACREPVLMPFCRYCPLCRSKVRRSWRIEGSEERCPRCRWGFLKDLWSTCPWCGGK